MAGKFVTIEGCEGVGKSTLIEGLKKYFAATNTDATAHSRWSTKDPG